MNKHSGFRKLSISFIGSVGIPNRYGGFESFLENCAPTIVNFGHEVTVTCDSNFYQNDNENIFLGVNRKFINVRANGSSSVLHDLVAFFSVFRSSTHIVILGVSGGIWFPFFRLFCDLFGKKLVVNIDGVEWRRSKYSFFKRVFLRICDFLSQCFSHHIIFDNPGLQNFILNTFILKSTCILYSGDHVKRDSSQSILHKTALTICRIEPENNIELLILAFLESNLLKYTIVGNWNGSDFGKSLRSKYLNNKRLVLLDPIYSQSKLSLLREQCSFYLHGHSVGGTNPSLVEILFYDCYIFCFDVSFNRYTAQNSASYFSNYADLVFLLNQKQFSIDFNKREFLRLNYSAKAISGQYLDMLHYLQ